MGVNENYQVKARVLLQSCQLTTWSTDPELKIFKSFPKLTSNIYLKLNEKKIKNNLCVNIVFYLFYQCQTWIFLVSWFRILFNFMQFWSPEGIGPNSYCHHFGPFEPSNWKLKLWIITSRSGLSEFSFSTLSKISFWYNDLELKFMRQDSSAWEHCKI